MAVALYVLKRLCYQRLMRGHKAQEIFKEYATVGFAAKLLGSLDTVHALLPLRSKQSFA